MTDEFHYSIPWRARGSHPGHHRGTSTGAGFEFRGHASLLDSPDPRRVDVRASLRDPFEQIVVRLYSQNNAIPVIILADLSASMGVVGHGSKLAMLADFTASLGLAAFRTGDLFGFFGCGAALDHDWVQPPTRARGAGADLAARLRTLTPTASSAGGLLTAAQRIAARRALIFIASDFHFPLELAEQLLTLLAMHTVVPVVLEDSAESQAPPAFGIARLIDSETGAERTCLLRPALRDRLVADFARWRASLESLCLTHHTRPLFLVDRFDAERVTRYFFA